MINKKYKAFISYSHADIKFARWLQRKIENYKISQKLREKYPHLPKDLKRSVFRDEEELPTSSTLPNNLTDALESSAFLIVIASPYSFNSKWVNKEITYFKKYHKNGQVLAIIKEGEPYAKEGELEAFPSALIANGDEPIAGDARSFLGRKRAVMKLIAGLLEVDFADLWEREKKDSRKRKFWFFLALSLFVSLAIYSSFQFHGNIVNDELLKIDKKIGEIKYELHHTSVPEERAIVLNKTLKKLKEKKLNREKSLESLGRLESSIGKEANRVYLEKGAKEAIKILSSKKSKVKREQKREELAFESITLATLYIEEYQFAKAKEAYIEAIEIFFSFKNVSDYAKFLSKQREPQQAIELYEKLNQKKNLLFSEKIELLSNLARVYDENNQLEKSEKTYKEVLNLYREKPNYLLKKLALTLNNLGKLYWKTNRLEASIASHQEALKIIKILEDTNPKEYKVELFSIVNSLGIVYKEMNSFEKAEQYSVEALALVRKVSKKYPHKYKGDLARLLFNLSFIYQTNKKFSKSKAVFTESLRMTRTLAQENPALYKEALAKRLGVISSRYFMLNKKEKAEEALNESLKLSKELFRKNPNLYSYLLSSALRRKGTEKTLQQKFPEALDFYYKALNVIEVLKISNPNAYQEQSGEIYLQLSSLYFPFLFKPKKAEECILKALNFYTLLAKKHPQKFNSSLADTFVELGRFYMLQNKMDKAEENYLKSVKIYRTLAVKNPKQYNGDLATKLNELANFYKAIKALKKSETIYIEALKIEREIVRKYPEFLSRVQLAQILWHFSLLYLEQLEDIVKSEKLMLESLQIEERLTQENNSSIYLKNFSEHLNTLGVIYTFTNQLQKAEDILLKSLKINSHLVKLDSKTYQKNMADNLHQLASLYNQLKYPRKAKEHCIKALKIFKEIHEPVVSAFIGIDLSKAEILTLLAKLEKGENHIKKAESYYLESLKIRRDIVKMVSKNQLAFGTYFLKLQKVALSHLLIDLAQFYLKQKEEKKAKKHYREGLNLQHSLLQKGIVDYHISYALSVITGVKKFDLPLSHLVDAKKRLELFRDKKNVNNILELINALD